MARLRFLVPSARVRLAVVSVLCLVSLLLTPSLAFMSPGRDTIGNLTVITDPYPQYSGPKTDSDQLTIIRAEDMSTTLSPVTLDVYSPFTFVYDVLIWMDEFTLDPKPWLATSWEISADGKTYTYKIRSDVKWHDGTPLTAADVAFSYKLYRDDPESGLARFFVLMKDDPVAVDDTTMRVTLSDTSGDFILNAGNQFVIQKKQFEQYWNEHKTLNTYDFASNMLIGTGPWKQVTFNPSEQYLEYERNENYWVEVPHFKKLVFRHNANGAARNLAWKNGETDLLWPVSATDVDQVKDREGWLYSAYAIAFMCAWFNFSNPNQEVKGLFDDKRVRQALSYAIDREGYADAIFKGFIDEKKIGTVALPWAYNNNLSSPARNLDTAKQLLADAGWTLNANGKLANAQGQEMKLTALVQQAPQYPVDKIMEVVQENLRELGIDMAIDKVENATYRKRWQQTHDWDLLANTRILFPGFSDYTYYHSSWSTFTNPQGRNYGGWKNAEADKLLDQIIREPNLDKQKALLARFQEIIADDMPALWFGFPRDLILVQKNIQGYQPNVGWQYWDTWKLWRTQ